MKFKNFVVSLIACVNYISRKCLFNGSSLCALTLPLTVYPLIIVNVRWCRNSGGSFTILTFEIRFSFQDRKYLTFKNQFFFSKIHDISFISTPNWWILTLSLQKVLISEKKIRNSLEMNNHEKLFSQGFCMVVLI